MRPYAALLISSMEVAVVYILAMIVFVGSMVAHPNIVVATTIGHRPCPSTVRSATCRRTADDQQSLSGVLSIYPTAASIGSLRTTRRLNR